MRQWQLKVPLELVDDDRFLASQEDFLAWAEGRKQLRMEYFYRLMRRKYQILLDDNEKPEGGKWNYDSENRRGWRNKDTLPARPHFEIDSITTEVIELVSREFPDHPGDLNLFYLGVTAVQAESQLQWFIERGLPRFGHYQDAMAEESPWLFHALLSMYLNVGLLDPLQVCRAVETAWRAGCCDLSAASIFSARATTARAVVTTPQKCPAPVPARLTACTGILSIGTPTDSVVTLGWRWP